MPQNGTCFFTESLLEINGYEMLIYATIIKEVWGAVDSGSVKKLQVNMANIRKKLSLEPGDNRFIHNELGVGYRMYNDAE